MNKIDLASQAVDPDDTATTAGSVASTDSGTLFSGLPWADYVFIAGVLAIALPTFLFVATSTWSTEEGAYGPIILATGLWLLWHEWQGVRHLIKAPPAWHVAILLAIFIPIYLLARITQIVEIEGYAMYCVLLSAVYGLVGGRFMRAMFFPLLYLAFVFPPPDTVIYTLTLPLKMAITKTAIAFLQLFGMPIGGTGVTIQIGQYQLLVAAACSGLNSIVSLSALTLFYIYLMHKNERRHQFILLLFVLPVAIAANFFRVLILILLTYFAGEAVAQGFLHELAGMTMFILALLFIFLLDMGLTRMFARKAGRNDKDRLHG
ncbi:exosortase V [Porphyrobacter algicida]|uniref:Exosortase V n=1 Tax=Qipengyuania algicida TaxID=1836209 RepID=A0A845ADU5_9SPHN|nr:exosortase V [Qipengyuania algicida]MXP28652.1 exosortase V [Qipengyuania algicida]